MFSLPISFVLSQFEKTQDVERNIVTLSQNNFVHIHCKIFRTLEFVLQDELQIFERQRESFSYKVVKLEATLNVSKFSRYSVPSQGIKSNNTSGHFKP